jgi:ATP-binding cassette, subfamily F, member 3
VRWGILHLDPQADAIGPADTTSSPALRAEQIAVQTAEAKKQDARRAHLQSFVDRFKAKASKAKQAQSRVKMLEKMTPITPPEEAKKQVFTFPARGTVAPDHQRWKGWRWAMGGRRC